MLFHGDIHVPYAKFGMPMSQSKDDLVSLNIMVKILRSKIKAIQKSWMYLTHCTMVIHLHSMTMWKDKKSVAWTQSHVMNPIDLTLRSKVNVVSGIINVQDTSSHSDRTMCQIWYANVKANISRDLSVPSQEPILGPIPKYKYKIFKFLSHNIKNFSLLSNSLCLKPSSLFKVHVGNKPVIQCLWNGLYISFLLFFPILAKCRLNFPNSEKWHFPKWLIKADKSLRSYG